MKIFFILSSYKLPTLCCNLSALKESREQQYLFINQIYAQNRNNLYFKSIYSPQISLSLKPFLPLCVQINLMSTLKGSFTCQKKEKEKKELKMVFSATTKGPVCLRDFSFLATILLRRENLLFGQRFCSCFLVHICYTFISFKNSYHGNNSVYI